MEEKLIEIADTLGVEVSELWAWLKNGGIQAYQSAKVAELGTVVAISLLGLIVCLYFLFSSLSERKRIVVEFDKKRVDFESYIALSNLQSKLEESIDITMLLALIASSILIVALFMSLPSLIAWIVSPEGMVLRIIATGV